MNHKRHNRAILREAEVLAIRRAYAERPSTRRIAEAFRISRRTVQMIVQNRTWRHLT